MNENQENNPGNNSETQPTSSQQPQLESPSSVQDRQPAHHHTGAGIIVLAWLTYTFWGWLIMGVIWLAYIVYANAMTDQYVEDMVPYAIASSVVLLPIVLICDRFYRRFDTVKKSGGLAIVVIIHAVIFALLAITLLISTVFTGVKISLDSPARFEISLAGLLTTLTGAILCIGAFFKTLNPFKNPKIPKISNLSMLVVTLLFLVLAIAGPAVKSFDARSDRIIERGLQPINDAIGTYTRANKKLPGSLSDIKVQNEDSQYLLDKNLVEYKIDESISADSLLASESELRYQLCVEYKQAKNNSDTYEDYAPEPSGENSYDTYISTYRHGAGRQCYKLREIVYNTDNNIQSGIDLYYENDINSEPAAPRSNLEV